MRITDNPLRDLSRKMDEEEQWLASLPVCDDCGEPIQDDYVYDFDGVLFCPGCIKEHRRDVDDYL